MRTKLNYEVVRDGYGFNTITDRGAVLEINGKITEEDDMLKFLEMLTEESGYNFINGEWESEKEENALYYCVGYIEMDREDYSYLQDDYREVKKKFKEWKKGNK